MVKAQLAAFQPPAVMASQMQGMRVTLPYKMLSIKKERGELQSGRRDTRLRKAGETRITYGEQGRQQQINTNIKAFRKKKRIANIQDKFTLWPLRFIHGLKHSATFFRCFKNCPA